MMKKLKIGELAPDASVIVVNNEAVSLASLWSEGPTLLTFLRHFG
jgi:hypothetical protein